MTRPYPDAVAGPYDPPPHPFEDKEGRELTVRRYGDPEAPVDDEHEALVEMYVAFDPEDRAQGIPPVRTDAIEEWLDALFCDDCLNVLAHHGDEPVGHATLVPDRGDTYELAIFVLHTHQGAGIGTTLIEHLLGHAQEQGIGKVWLTVERWNDPAISLYEKVGFELSSSESFELEMAIRL